MEIKSEKKDTCLSICVNGRLDTLASREFMKWTEENLGDDITDVVIECSDLTYISSSGLRVLMTIYKKITPKHGKLSLKDLTPQVGEVLNITGMASLFSIE
ncbi:MAG: STAS domain-containing protein [Bacteroidales bacterium]|nr:STAS domain-containing protein [Bacteroidales bacterium]MBQ9888922.1 STAS domain-containing protein [Bacteroidales bacterium]